MVARRVVMCATPDYDPVVVGLRPGELRAAEAAYRATADPRNDVESEPGGVPAREDLVAALV